MPTLNEYRRRAGYTTIKAFAIAANITPSIASQWLSGHRSDQDDQALCALLKINQEQYREAYEASRTEAQARWKAKHPVTQAQREAHEASIKQLADEIYARSTPAQRANMHAHAVRLGIAQPDRRSPLDIMIDRACGLE